MENGDAPETIAVIMFCLWEGVGGEEDRTLNCKYPTGECLSAHGGFQIKRYKRTARVRKLKQP